MAAVALVNITYSAAHHDFTDEHFLLAGGAKPVFFVNGESFESVGAFVDDICGVRAQHWRRPNLERALGVVVTTEVEPGVRMAALPAKRRTPRWTLKVKVARGLFRLQSIGHILLRIIDVTKIR